MLRQRRGFFMKKAGFTLTEIVIVLIILGTIAGLALPRFTTSIEKMKLAEGLQVLTVLLGAQKQYALEYGAYATDVNDLDVTIVPKYFGTPVVYDDSSKVAEITRSTNEYTLTIDENGIIYCNSPGTLLCERLACGKGVERNQCNE